LVRWKTRSVVPPAQPNPSEHSSRLLCWRSGWDEMDNRATVSNVKIAVCMQGLARNWPLPSPRCRMKRTALLGLGQQVLAPGAPVSRLRLRDARARQLQHPPPDYPSDFGCLPKFVRECVSFGLEDLKIGGRVVPLSTRGARETSHDRTGRVVPPRETPARRPSTVSACCAEGPFLACYARGRSPCSGLAGCRLLLTEQALSKALTRPLRTGIPKTTQMRPLYGYLRSTRRFMRTVDTLPVRLYLFRMSYNVILYLPIYPYGKYVSTLYTCGP
jgi:hypothetical protein